MSIKHTQEIKVFSLCEEGDYGCMLNSKDEVKITVEISIGKAIDLPRNLEYRDLSSIWKRRLPKDLSKHNLEGTNLEGVNFKNCTLPDSLSYANCLRTNFRNIANESLNLSYANLIGAKLPLDLSKYILVGSMFEKADLSKHKLPINLSSVSFIKCKLPKDLRKHDLTGANLGGCDLTNVKLPEKMEYVILEGAKLPLN